MWSVFNKNTNECVKSFWSKSDANDWMIAQNNWFELEVSDRCPF